MSKELKPCPFCGSDEINYMERQYIECCSCGCILPWEQLTDYNGNPAPEDYIVDRWNDRVWDVAKQKTSHVDGAGFDLYGHCHECGKAIISSKYKYCPECGRKLHWS